MGVKSMLSRLGLAVTLLSSLAACDESEIAKARGQVAVHAAFTELTKAADVRSALTLASVPKAGFRAVHSQLQGVAPESAAAVPMRGASVGKMFTATLVLQLVEEGRLRLDQPLAELLSDADMPAGFQLAQLHFAAGNAIGDRITVRQLLNHTSGLADIFFDAAPRSSISFSDRYILNLLGVRNEGMEQKQWQGGRDLLGYYFAENYHEIASAQAAFHYSREVSISLRRLVRFLTHSQIKRGSISYFWRVVDS